MVEEMVYGCIENFKGDNRDITIGFKKNATDCHKELCWIIQHSRKYK